MPSGKDVSVMAEKPTIYVKPSEKLLENSQKSVLQTLKTKLLENPPVKVAKNSLIPTEESIKMQLLKNLQSKLPELIPITDDISIAAPDISDNNNIPIEGCSEDIIEIKKEVKSEVPLEDDTPLVIDTHDDIEEGPVDLSAKFKSVAVQTEHSLNQLLALRLRQILLEISLEVVASNQRDTVKDRLNKSLLLFLESLEQIQQTQQECGVPLSLPIQPTADDWQPSQPESIPAATFSHHQPLITSLNGGQQQSQPAVSRINLSQSSQDVVASVLGGNNNQQQISRIQLLEPQSQDSHDQLAAALTNHQLPQQQTRIQLLQQPDNNLHQQPRIQLLTTPDPHDNNHQQQATRIQVLQHHSSSNPSIQILDSLTGIDTDIHQRESINGLNLDDIGINLSEENSSIFINNNTFRSNQDIRSQFDDESNGLHQLAQAATNITNQDVMSQVSAAWKETDKLGSSVNYDAESIASTGSHSETTSNANSNGGRKSRDEKTIQELGIPYTMDKIINCSMDDFNAIITSGGLTEEQINTCRDIRRRGKNKVAAQNCRKRKVDQISLLADEVEAVKKKKQRIMSEREQLTQALTAWSAKLARLERFLLDKLNRDARAWKLTVLDGSNQIALVPR